MRIKGLLCWAILAMTIGAAPLPTRADPFPGRPVYKDSERFQELSPASESRVLRTRALPLRRSWVVEERFYDAAHELGLGRPSFYGTRPPCNCD